MNIVQDNIFEKINLILYKSKNLFFYIIIGIFSLFIELQLRKYIYFLIENDVVNYISLIFGIFLAFVLNINFNFNIPKKFFYRSLFFFFFISILSFVFQQILKNYLVLESLTYDEKDIIFLV